MTGPRTYPVRKGETVTLRVESLAFGGQGVARVEGFTVFVPSGLPGQLVEALVLRRRKGYAEARIERILEPSPDQTEPRCEHFGVCGGCLLQHYAYPAQLEAKRGQVADCLVRLGGLPGVTVEEPVAAPDAYEYRNKMEYSFGPRRWLEAHELDDEAEHDRFGLGLHPRGRHDRVLNAKRCHLQDETGSAVLRLVRDAARRSGMPAYSTRDHQGFWRFLVLRVGQNTGQRMVFLITAEARPGRPEARAVENLAAELRGAFPDLTSIIHGESDNMASVATAERLRVLYGEPVIQERVAGFTFEIGPGTFFQTNTRQAERLFALAVDHAALTPDDVVWDLYCGVGALTLPLAARARLAVGMELVEESVAAARRNAAANGVVNTAFHSGDIRALLRDGSGHPRPDVVVLDPPREGVHADVLAAVAERAPRRIVYVSCNPATLARDLAGLAQTGYRVDGVQPVDMFPHTAHIECVARLSR